MNTRYHIPGFLLAISLLLVACAGGNLPLADPLPEGADQQEAGLLSGEATEVSSPIEEKSDEPLETFEPTLSPLFEQSYRANPVSDRDYSQYEIITVLPQDAIPAIDRPSLYKAERADREYEPDEIVIGVEFNGDARAYPIDILSRHEIVNDTVGGIHLAVTW
jgi:hypothetical protein